MPNKFCGFLSNGLYITDKKQPHSKKLSFSPCCFFETSVFDLSAADWNNINDWTWMCKVCNVRESNVNSTSYRKVANELVKDVEENDTRPIYVMIDYSNGCNAACGICDSLNSVNVAKAWKDYGFSDVPTPKVKQSEFFSAIENIDFSNVKVLSFRGGEPFYNDFPIKVIKKIVNPKETILKYNTNGSIYPSDEWWNVAAEFKKVEFTFSIDAIDKKFEFIRSNLNWQQVYNNIIKIITDKRANIECRIECTINPLNAWYYDEMLILLKQLRHYNKTTQLSWHHAWGTWHLANTPPLLREKLKEKFGSTRIFIPLFENLTFDAQSHKNFCENLKKHELRYKVSGENTFKEIWKDVFF